MTASDEIRSLGQPIKDGGYLVGKTGWEGEEGDDLQEWPALVNTFLDGRYYARGQCYVGKRAPNKHFKGYVLTEEERQAAIAAKEAEAERLLEQAEKLKGEAVGLGSQTESQGE